VKKLKEELKDIPTNIEFDYGKPTDDGVNQQKIVDFFRKNPDPTEMEVHNFAEEIGIECDELKTKIYKLLSDMINDKKEITPPVELAEEEESVIGGKADGKPDEKYDAEQLRKGIKIESEHTDDSNIAKEIAKDHLEEDPLYYNKLENMEKSFNKESKIMKNSGVLKEKLTNVIREWMKNKNIKSLKEYFNPLSTELHEEDIKEEFDNESEENVNEENEEKSIEEQIAEVYSFRNKRLAEELRKKFGIKEGLRVETEEELKKREEKKDQLAKKKVERIESLRDKEKEVENKIKELKKQWKEDSKDINKKMGVLDTKNLKEEEDIGKNLEEENLQESTPEGYEKIVKGIKKDAPETYVDKKTGEKKKTNPWAIAWSMKKKGIGSKD